MMPNRLHASLFAPLAHASSRTAAAASTRCSASSVEFARRSPSVVIISIDASRFRDGRSSRCASVLWLSVPCLHASATCNSKSVNFAPASRSAETASASPNRNAHAAPVRFHRSHASSPPWRVFNGAHAVMATRMVAMSPLRTAKCRIVCLSASLTPAHPTGARRMSSSSISTLPRAAAMCVASVFARDGTEMSAPASSNARTTEIARGDGLAAAARRHSASGSTPECNSAHTTPTTPRPHAARMHRASASKSSTSLVDEYGDEHLSSSSSTATPFAMR
mmetsp:Transcript_1136/g.3549  ORF Transcript_1136/g.3549 Transcript_1136/m.3549 type:complete len:279 (-) Transcript_1136:1675-2511(-)